MGQRAEAPAITLDIKHGHNDDQVVVIFNHPVTQLGLTEKQAEDFMAALANSLEKLRAHKAKRR